MIDPNGDPLEAIRRILARTKTTITSYGSAEATSSIRAPMVNVQWKGTPACLDFQCVCSETEDAYEFHLDDVQFGKFTCPRCDRKWQLGQPPIEEGKP